ncbi:actin bundling protein [Pelomyxa schiedti]|nr:actin bundling protein [Pelomyxa schiedti]
MAATRSASFVQRLEPDAMEFFTTLAKKPFSQQAVAFLNAYWLEVKSDAEFIFGCSYEMMKYADMHAKGISLVYKYEEGVDLDFDIGLYFFEQLCRFLDEPKNAHWRDQYPKSQPVMMTALKRKQELREKVDVNFDGRISFLEYLLYQYQAVANPADFCKRSMSAPDEHPEIRKARLALEEVSAKIRGFEEEKAKLEAEAKEPGVKGLRATNMLAQIESSPTKDQLNRSLITAEAAVRIASRKFGGGASSTSTGTGGGSSSSSSSEGPGSDGAIWWMQRDLEEKKKRYAPKPKTSSS